MIRIGYDAKRFFHNATGLGNYSRDTVRILCDFYPKNNYFLYNPKKGKINRFQGKELAVEVKYPTSKFWKKLSSIWRQKAIVKQLVKDKIDIYHGLTGELPIGINKTGIKTVVTIHDLIFIRYPELYSFFDRKIYFYKFKHAAEIADVVVAISEQTKIDIVKYLKISPEKIKVIFQGCHQIFKEDAAEKVINNIITTLNLPEKFVLNVGTIEERKNLLTLVKALKNINIPLIVVGKSTAYTQKVTDFIKENNMQESVHFLEGLSMEQLAVVYKRATIFVYPSIFEGFGIPIVEALYSKTPVITSKGGCFPEAGGPDSIYVASNDIDALNKEIVSLLNDKERRKVMAEKGFEYAQRFNDEVIAENLMQLYSDL